MRSTLSDSLYPFQPIIPLYFRMLEEGSRSQLLLAETIIKCPLSAWRKTVEKVPQATVDHQATCNG